MSKSMSMLIAGLGLSGCLSLAVASPVSIPNTFTAGTKAVAAEVNGDFTAVKTAVNDNNTRIAKLEATIATLQASLKKVSGNTVLDLDKSLVYTTDANGHPTAQFTGINVQVVNGKGSTNTANGLGNLIIGYNEPDTTGNSHCTIGYDVNTNTPVTDATSCNTAKGQWTTAGFKTGSHYLVMGWGNNYSRWGGIVAGVFSTSNFDYASVLGGFQNTASGPYSSVSGGYFNTASGAYSSVSGGTVNTASGQSSSVSGGDSKTASGTNDWAAGSYSTP